MRWEESSKRAEANVTAMLVGIARTPEAIEAAFAPPVVSADNAGRALNALIPRVVVWIKCLRLLFIG